jgi:pilus assembly protein CpaC
MEKRMSKQCRAAKLGFVIRVAIIAGLSLVVLPGVKAQQPSPAGQTQAATHAALAQPAVQSATVQKESSQESEAPQELHLLVGRSLVITSPTRIKRVSLADPAIAEAIVVSPYQVLLNGKTPGGVSLLLWDEANQSQAFEVSVDIDVLSLTQKIHDVFPSEQVQVETSKDVVMLSGRISSAAVADKILEVVKNATPKVTSLMEVPPPPYGEILLEVKFAEVDRSNTTQLGINILSLPGAKNIGTITTGQFGPPILQGGQITGTSTLSVGSLLNLFIFRPDINFAATIQALQAQNLLQILAEPNLLTSSGKDASFLAGGEFPYPVVQGGGTGGFAPITIQFKEFGIRLNFTPTLTADGLIHLKVKPEVSTLDFSNALTIQGFLIPALSTRRAESEMDLRDGQSFAMAGLLDNRVQDQFDKIPGIGDIPVLGKLFQSRNRTKTNNELLVLVTPRIVQPLAPGQAPAGPGFPQPFLPSTVPQGQQPPGSK